MNIPTIIRALGRGKKGTRDISKEEAHFVMSSILDETITSAQLGAFLMLMRVKEETAEELSGMVNAVAEHSDYSPTQSIDVNWPAYAGKKKQPSWYILAAKLLAQNGIKILIHGGGEHTEGRQYAGAACEFLNIPTAMSLKDAEQKIETHNICYVAMKNISPKISDLIDMKAELGLRSPVNTLVRHINPLNASLTLQGMFHPAYMPLHHQCAELLGQTNNIVLKGDGGEFEVRPDSKTTVSILGSNFEAITEVEPVMKARAIRPDSVTLKPLEELWSNTEQHNEYGTNSVIQTSALILSRIKSIELLDAQKIVKSWWDKR